MSQNDQSDVTSDPEFPRADSVAEQTLGTNDQDTATAINQVKDYHLKMIDIAQANADSAFDFARELVGAKTPSALMGLCMTRAQKQFEQLTDQTSELTELGQETVMPNVYIKASPIDSPEHDPINAFAVENYAGQVLGTFETWMEAVIWTKEEGHEPFVARDNHTHDKDNPDDWQAF